MSAIAGEIDDGASVPSAGGASPGVAVARGALALLSTQPLTWSVSLALLVLLPHYLGAYDLGIYAVAATSVALVTAIVSLGVPSFLVRHVAEHPEDTVAATENALVLLCGLMATVVVVAWFAVPLVEHNRLTIDVIRLLLVGSVFSTGLSVLYASMNGRGHHSRFAWLNAAIAVTGGGVQIAVLASGGGLRGICLASACAGALALVVAWKASSVHISYRLLHIPLLVEISRAGVPFLAWNITILVRNGADIILIGILIGATPAGWLSAAYRIVNIPLFIATIIVTPLFPALARCGDDPRAFREILRNSLLAVVLLTLPASVEIAVLAPRLPGLLHWPNDFMRIVMPLRILAIQPTLVAMDMVLGTALFAIHRERSWLSVAVIAALFSPLANLAVLPLAQHFWANGATGAAIVEVCTEVILFVGALLLLPSNRLPTGLGALFSRATIAGVVMLGVGLLALQHSLALALVAPPAAYLATALVTRLLSVDQVVDVARMVLPASSLSTTRSSATARIRRS